MCFLPKDHAESTPILVANKRPYHRWSPFAYDFLCPFPGCLHTFVQIFSHVTGRLARFAWLRLGFGRQSGSTVSPNVRLQTILVYSGRFVWFDFVCLFGYYGLYCFISISVDCKSVFYSKMVPNSSTVTMIDMAKLNHQAPNLTAAGVTGSCCE